MAFSKRSISPRRSRRLSRKAQSSTLGTYNSVASHSTGKHRAGSDPGLSGSLSLNSRRQTKKANAGYVKQVAPRTSSAETVSDYSRRVRQGDYVEQTRRSHQRRRGVTIALVIAIVVAVALTAGIATYFLTVNSRLALHNSNASEALVEATDGPRYLLCAASLGTALNPDDPSGDAYMLVRYDSSAKQLTFVDIPASIMTITSDSQRMTLYEARAMMGDAELVNAIASLADVKINGFVSTDAEGIKAMTERLGSVRFDVTEMIDDPRAGTSVLDAGEAQLDGQGALLVLRALNYQHPYETRAQNRVDFTMALVDQYTSSKGNAGAIADLSADISTSATTNQLLEMADTLSPLSDVRCFATVVPGRVASDGSGRFVVSRSAWNGLIAAIKEGKSPNEATPIDPTINPASLTIEVRNGGGVSGVAASVGSILTGQGYNVTYVGNMEDGATYNETFVIYKDSNKEAAAQRIVSEIGVGRAINGGDYYTFGTDLMVVVGKDYVIPA